MHTVVSEQITVYRVKYPDGVLSEGVYNQTRAHEFANRLNDGQTNPRIRFKPFRIG